MDTLQGLQQMEIWAPHKPPAAAAAAVSAAAAGTVPATVPLACSVVLLQEQA